MAPRRVRYSEYCLWAAAQDRLAPGRLRTLADPECGCWLHPALRLHPALLRLHPALPRLRLLHDELRTGASARAADMWRRGYSVFVYARSPWASGARAVQQSEQEEAEEEEEEQDAHVLFGGEDGLGGEWEGPGALPRLRRVEPMRTPGPKTGAGNVGVGRVVVPLFCLGRGKRFVQTPTFAQEHGALVLN